MTRGEVHLVRLDPTPGSQIQKTRPCVIVSPDELNQHLRTVIVAPLTTGGRTYLGAPAAASRIDRASSFSTNCAPWITSVS